jgi:hypothetical protein
LTAEETFDKKNSVMFITSPKDLLI